MVRASYFARFCAVAAMLHFQGNSIEAKPLFLKYCPNHGLHENLHTFLKRWWERYEHCPEGDCFLEEPSRPGRPARLERADIEAAAHAFNQGYYHHGKKDGYDSVEQASAGARWRHRPAAITHHPTQRNPPVLASMPIHSASTAAGCREEQGFAKHPRPHTRLT